MKILRRIPPGAARFPIMVVAFLGLFSGILGGLNRLGFGLHWFPARFALHHGGLMVSSFLGTVIGLERAVAVPIRGSLLVPLTTATGTVVLLFFDLTGLGVLLIVLSSLGLLGLFLFIFWTQQSLHNLVLVAGGICWVAGNASWWFQLPGYDLVHWWIGFLVLVVAAERLELNRLKQFSTLQVTVFTTGVVLALGGMLAVTMGVGGHRLLGLGLVVLATWLIQNDMVRNMLFMEGEKAYTGWCLFSGYFWLVTGGLLLASFPDAQSGFLYDAYLHCIFVGFVFTMIFGHVFIIMPGVLKLDLHYHPVFFLPLILLEGTLLVRITGDLLFNQVLRSWGGLGNGLSILLFFVMLPLALVAHNLRLRLIT